MANSRIDFLRRWTGLWNSGARDALAADLDPDFELHSPFSALSGEPYRGAAGFERWLADIANHFVSFDMHVESVREAGPNRLLGVGHVRVRGRESGVTLDQSAAVLVDFRGERVLRARIYLSEAEADAAAGLD